MFFSVEKATNTNFPKHFYFGNLVINTDNGWHLKSFDECTYLFKGYADNYDLEQCYYKVTSEEPGNFCIFKIYNNTVEFIPSLIRSFPLYYKQGQQLTNLWELSSTCHADKKLGKFDENLEFIFTKETANFTWEELDENLVIEKIYNIISEKILNFVKHNQMPIKVFLTGGVDSTLIYSFFQKYNIDVELLNYLHVDLDYFLAKNYSYLKDNYWAYTQIHHFKTPCVLVSGAPGDEFMLRSPAYSNIYLKSFGTDILSLANNQHGSQKSYLLKYKNKAVYEQQNNDPLIKKIVIDKNIMRNQLCRIILNDFQHWHLGNTITFTPLADLEIYKLCLQLPFDSAVAQIFDSSISKKLIAMNNPKLLDLLSNEKNHNSFENLAEMLH